MLTFQQELVLMVLDKLAIALLLLVIGFFLNRQLEKFRSQQEVKTDLEQLRAQTELGYIQQQIDELYGPLFGLIQNRHAVYTIYKKRLQLAKSEDETGTIMYHYRKEYILPINQKIVDLLSTKTHLVETDKIPDSFAKFMVHSAQLETLLTLGADKGLGSEGITPEPYPEQLDEDVRQTLEQLWAKQNYYRQQIIETK